MADKVIDFNKTVFELCNEDPDIANILAEIGFTDILRPGMIKTAGRFMTIPKGAAMKKIDLEYVKGQFAERGYNIII
ncbi:MAG: DUF1858 domain-containing protein [Eubacteriales bacterium]|jgi:hypothetical protein|nr:DUF1858 domain-containing protein [Eubacteriales bacterium]